MPVHRHPLCPLGGSQSGIIFKAEYDAMPDLGGVLNGRHTADALVLQTSNRCAAKDES